MDDIGPVLMFVVFICTW